MKLFALLSILTGLTVGLFAQDPGMEPIGTMGVELIYATNGPVETDIIKDFRFDDVIDLGDLLNTAQTVSNLDQYLDFSQGTNGVNINIDTNQDGATDHIIVLENQTLSSLGWPTGTSDTDILTNMLNHNTLDTLA